MLVLILDTNGHYNKPDFIVFFYHKNRVSPNCRVWKQNLHSDFSNETRQMNPIIGIKNMEKPLEFKSHSFNTRFD